MIIVSPYDGIETVLDRYQPSSAISILDQGEPMPALPNVAPDQHLKLCVSMAAAEMTAPPCPVQETERIEQLITFAQNIDWSHALLIHCRLGISRSPGAAYIIQCALSPSRPETAIAEELRNYSAKIEPSIMMVTIADDLLDRDGRMIDAIDDMGDGCSCLAGDILEIPYLPEK